MLDAKVIREGLDGVRRSLLDRGHDPTPLERFLEADGRWRTLTEEANGLRKQRNDVAAEIPTLSEDAKSRKIDEMKAISSRVKEIDDELRQLDAARTDSLLKLPNIPDESVPVGNDSGDNPLVRSYGEPRKFDFDPLPHWELGERLDIVDFERGAKVAGTGFYVLKGDGAKLERALINFMLDLHERQGYREIFPPVVVNRDSCVGTGQLPIMHDDMYWMERDDLYLNPTAEVPVTNLYRDEILDGSELPICLTAYLPSFRREAGKHIETKGIARVHQFNKVELVKFTLPEESQKELDLLLTDAEAVLKALELPFRTMLLCTGDLGFASSKTYDIEAFAPGMSQWLEVSSCSDFKSFQARRAMIKFRREPHLKSEYVHTLNGSGIALARTFAAVVEHYQNADGSITVPEVLRPYMGGKETIC